MIRVGTSRFDQCISSESALPLDLLVLQSSNENDLRHFRVSFRYPSLELAHSPLHALVVAAIVWNDSGEKSRVRGGGEESQGQLDGGKY